MHENTGRTAARTARTGNLLGAAALTVSDRMTRAAADATGVSVSGTAALVTLLTSPGIGVTRLGTRIGLSQPACARMLDQLQARELVTRRREGGRLAAVELTGPGRDAARAALSARQRELNALVDRLGEERRAGLTAGLEALLDLLHDEVGSEYVLCRLCDRPACVRGGEPCPVGAAARAHARAESDGGGTSGPDG
ncbi:MarR family winged helix-turn-helix transcriptional regulator [Streptomyces sp. NPDC048639]|uniref:MarR family winged helix-turn-helix transcriptional regulator n=1 Tax=Streptomyces sp. NPDC048639 TaxID=3365581 RepID=UPI00371E3545